MSEYTEEDLIKDEMAEEVIELLEDLYQSEMPKINQLQVEVLQEKYGFSFNDANQYIDMWESQYDRH